MSKERMLVDAKKRQEIVAIISVGCSRETAARYVGCSTDTIRREMKRDEIFASEIRTAEEQSEIYYLTKIHNAANKEQYWRAAAWALERRCPNRYAARGAKSLSEEQVLHLIGELTETVLPEVKNKSQRKRILDKVEKLTRTLALSEVEDLCVLPSHPDDETDTNDNT